jgi:hypothetical protein
VAQRDTFRRGCGVGLTSVQAARCCPNRGAPGASDAWALVDNGRERGRRESGHVGQPGEKGKWVEPEGTGGFSIYSNRIQTNWNNFDQMVDVQSFENST